MKNFTSLIIAVFISLGLSAQNQEAYLKAMGDNMKKMESSKTASDWQTLAGTFDRISKVASENWIPSYYSVYSYIIASFIEKEDDTRDAILDKAQLILDASLKKFEKESELVTLQGFIWQARMSVKGSRGMTYGSKTTEILSKATKLNPNNARAYYLLGSNILHTPKMFGGGKEKALAHLQKANDLYNSFHSELPFYPNWGKEDNKKLLDKCSSK